MREITSHHTNAANRAITIAADEPDPNNGNASHVYTLEIHDPHAAYTISTARDNQLIEFQHGPIAEVGINGITNEALLAIVIDRLQGFQTSKYACRENALALTKLQEAAMWLEWRTKARTARGVEGTHNV